MRLQVSGKMTILLILVGVAWWWHSGHSKQQAFQQLKHSPSIVFPADGSEKARLYVFTDPDCSACKHLHKMTKALNNKGVSLHFYPLPLMSGINYNQEGELVGSRANDIRAVWCSQFKQGAFNTLFHGGKVSLRSRCVNPLEEHVRYAGELKVRGVPTLFNDKGESIPLWSDANNMVKALGI